MAGPKPGAGTGAAFLGWAEAGAKKAADEKAKAEATAALAAAPVSQAGGYVTMIKDIALAIAALKAL